MGSSSSKNSIMVLTPPGLKNAASSSKSSRSSVMSGTTNGAPYSSNTNKRKQQTLFRAFIKGKPLAVTEVPSNFFSAKQNDQSIPKLATKKSFDSMGMEEFDEESRFTHLWRRSLERTMAKGFCDGTSDAPEIDWWPNLENIEQKDNTHFSLISPNIAETSLSSSSSSSSPWLVGLGSLSSEEPHHESNRCHGFTGAIPNWIKQQSPEISNDENQNTVEPVMPMKYLESSEYHLTLREIVYDCAQTGADAKAIDIITKALIHDNAISRSLDLASFSLTALWGLALKNDENKHKILFGDASKCFGAIIKTMKVYCERSVDIQTRACTVLWSLSTNANGRKHISKGGGCEAILNAMVVHTREDGLQAMALIALRLLSFDSFGKLTMSSWGASSIVADILQRHQHNPTIQSEGCKILDNLAVGDASHSSSLSVNGEAAATKWNKTTETDLSRAITEDAKAHQNQCMR